MLQRSMLLRIVAFLVLGASVTALTVQAEPQSSNQAPASSEVNSKELLAKQQELLRKYKSVTDDLLTLVHRFEKSPRVEDQDKAKLIRRAIEVGDKEGVDNKFQALLRTLAGKNGTITLIGVTQAKNENEDLVRVLREIFNILNNDDELERNREEQRRLEKALADLKGLIRDSQVTRARVEAAKIDPAKLAKDQEKNAKEKLMTLPSVLKVRKDRPKIRKTVRKRTAKTGMGKDGKDPKDGKDGKDGMGKEWKAIQKTVKMARTAWSKDGKDGKDGKPKDGKPSDGKPKDGKPSDGKPKDGKPSDGKPKDGKPSDGEPKDGKPSDGEPKDGMGKGGMGGEGSPETRRAKPVKRPALAERR